MPDDEKQFLDWLDKTFGWFTSKEIQITRKGKAEVGEFYYDWWVAQGKPSQSSPQDVYAPPAAGLRLPEVDYLENAGLIAREWIKSEYWTLEEAQAALGLLWDEMQARVAGDPLPDFGGLRFDDLTKEVAKLRTGKQKEIQTYIEGDYDSAQVQNLITEYTNIGLLTPEYSDYAIEQIKRKAPELFPAGEAVIPTPKPLAPPITEEAMPAELAQKQQNYVAEANRLIDYYVQTGASGWTPEAGQYAKTYTSMQVEQYGIQPNTYLYEQIVAQPQRQAEAQRKYEEEVAKVKEYYGYRPLTGIPPSTEGEIGEQTLLGYYDRRKTGREPGVTFYQWLQSPEGKAIQSYTGITRISGRSDIEEQVAFLEAQKKAREYRGDTKGAEETNVQLEAAKQAQSLAAKGAQFLGGQEAYAKTHPEYAKMSGEERRALSAAGLETAGEEEGRLVWADMSREQKERYYTSRGLPIPEEPEPFLPFEPPISTTGLGGGGTLRYRQWFERAYPSIVRGFMVKPTGERTQESWAKWLKSGTAAAREDWFAQAPFERGERPSAYAPKIRMVNF